MIGNDAAITIGGMNGHFELNVYIPLMARNLIQSITLLASASRLLAEKCVDGIEANREQCEAYAELTLVGGDGAQPVHRVRQGVRDREDGGRERPLAARRRPRGRCGGERARRGARLPRDGQAARLGRRRALHRPVGRRRSLSGAAHGTASPGHSATSRDTDGGGVRPRSGDLSSRTADSQRTAGVRARPMMQAEEGPP